MEQKVKVNDLVSLESPAGESLEAKVSWIDNEDCGLVFTAPPHYAGNATIDKVSKLTVIQSALGSELKDMTDEELRNAILELRKFRKARPIKQRVSKPRTKKEIPKEIKDEFDELVELQKKLDSMKEEE